MNELLSQLWTPELQQAFTYIVVFLVILYVLSIIWVVRDAYLRGSFWYIWALVALIPLIGVIAYTLLRPPLLQIDRDEQELEIAIKQRELMKYGECAKCGYPVEDTYVLCPNCQQQLRNLCSGCGKALEPSWKVCPYCTTPAGSLSAPRRSPQRSRPASAPVKTAPRQGAETSRQQARTRNSESSLERPKSSDKLHSDNKTQSEDKPQSGSKQQSESKPQSDSKSQNEIKAQSEVKSQK